MSYLTKTSQYTLREIGAFLTVADILVLAKTCLTLNKVFGHVHNIYKRECMRIYTSELPLFR